MVVFGPLRWKNFLSTGNAWNEISLNAESTTLIVGANGSGKSTLLDVLCFVLFGKPFRNINKGQLTNSINQKNLLTEIEFTVGKHQYKVIRGIRPNVFEIWKNKVLLNQDAVTKDYQAVLEEQILNFTYKSFTQIVILGSAAFTPFMELSSGLRREIIEDLLDIRIFSSMNKVLKEQLGSLTVRLINLEGEIEIQKRKVMVQRSYINTLNQDQKEKIIEIEKIINNTKSEIVIHEKETKHIQGLISSLMKEISDHSEIQNKVQTLQNSLTELKINQNHIHDHLKFYKNNSKCPTCTQVLEENFRSMTVTENEKILEALETKSSNIDNQLLIIKNRLEKIWNVNKTIADYNTAMMVANNKIQAGQQYINKLITENKGIQVNTTNIDDEKTKLKLDSQGVVDLLVQRSTFNEDKKYMNAASMLLKDTGIKTKIIKQYLPLINKLVNKYLQAMDLFVNFELDETFTETIKSRYRDEFTYTSFSEGEKQRINLALLFAWRAVAAARNTNNTNLLLFDEILDGSLDATAVDYFLELVKDIGKKHNIFVISHKKDLFADKFDRCIMAEKVGEYSILKEIEK